MIFGSVCSGIEAASVAWKPLGWKASFFSEIEKFPSAVLDHHYPTVPNLGDMTKFKEWPDAIIDVLVGGTPCQSFSIAGLRKGLDDPRGNLMLTYLAIAARYRPKWLVWENVPGVLSSNGGKDFGTLLGGLGELGYGFAYRVLDAQYFGVPQRRRRVFVVGHLGNWRRAAAVLFERHSLSGNPAPSRQAGKDTPVCPTLRAGGNRTGGDRPPGTDVDTADSLIVTHSLRGEGFDASEDGTGRGTPLTVVPTLTSNGDAHSGYRDEHGLVPVGITIHGTDKTARVASYTDTAGSLRTKPPGSIENSSTTAVMTGMQVRRLTPRECARLQGFPDDYLDITHNGKPAADGPKYKALGNSMAVPCMSWIGERIAMVDQIAQ